jgi:hypothetical protein
MADLEATDILYVKSRLLKAAEASFSQAPITVALLNSC